MGRHLRFSGEGARCGKSARRVLEGPEVARPLSTNTLGVNARNGWKGYLWQYRFSSFPMDDRHLLIAARYIELNPVKAGLAQEPEDYPWSSARAHLCGVNDPLVNADQLLDRVRSWKDFLNDSEVSSTETLFEQHERTGRPLGDIRFIQELQDRLKRPLVPRKAGRKPREIGIVSPY